MPTLTVVRLISAESFTIGCLSTLSLGAEQPAVSSLEAALSVCQMEEKKSTRGFVSFKHTCLAV